MRAARVTVVVPCVCVCEDTAHPCGVLGGVYLLKFILYSFYEP